MRGRFSRVVLVAACLCTLPTAIPRADEHPSLNSRAVEVGGTVAITTVEGVSTAAVGVRSGMFFGLLTGMLGVEAGAAFRHVASSNVFDLELQTTWQQRLRNTSNYPFVAAAAGLRHEEIGSFGQSRYPVGMGLGVRTLFGQRAALRTEYQYRRVLNDPIADFNEHQILVGISLFFRNESKP